MKVKGQIFGIEAVPGKADAFAVRIAAQGRKHSGGRDQEILVELVVEASRGTLRDFAMGDFFEITLEKV
jgi:hypothetical protein